MAKYTQSDHVLASHQALTHPGIFVGVTTNEIDVTTKLFGQIYIYHANIEETANVEGVRYAIQTSRLTSTDDDWLTAVEFRTDVAAAASEAMTATEAAGVKVLAVAAITGFVEGEYLYIQDTGALANSEWRWNDLLVASTSIDIIDGLTTGKDSSDVIFNKAEQFYAKVDFGGVKRVRLFVWHRAAAGSNLHFKADMTTTDSIG